MIPSPADSPEPAPERPIPWWRHWRRLFYLAVIGATVTALWCGWSWWYRAGFPMPGYAQSRALGMDHGAHIRWVHKPQLKLQEWKKARETRRLRLSGTVWRDTFSGVILTFGTDGRLGVTGPPGWEDRVKGMDPFAAQDGTERERAAMPTLHLNPYRISPPAPGSFTDHHPLDLFLPDSL